MNFIDEIKTLSKLEVILENCYGIKKLEHNFDFSEDNTYAIYAGNGIMKTSFARTFKDLSEGNDSKDLMFPDRKTIRKIVDEDNNPITEDQVFVIEPYQDLFEPEKVSTLVVKKELKVKYDKIHLEIDNKKEEIIKKLKALESLSGFKKDIEEELSETFNCKNDFFICLENLKTDILDGKISGFTDVVYIEIFNEKVINFLKTKGFKEKLEEYIEKYNELIDSSLYFKKGIFSHNNADNTSKNLEKEGFFKAEHSILLKNKSGKEKEEITKKEEFNRIIHEEKNKILNNPDLTKKFEEIDTAIIKNIELRKFRNYLENNPEIIPELINLNGFRKKLWISYLKEEKDIYAELLKQYQSGKNEIEEIIKQAKEEKTDWENVINCFNERFFVPFKLKIENQEDVILNNEVPSISFEFQDSSGEIRVEKDKLLNVLSNGEKRALYILNIIFEIEARKKERQETLFIIDDIADSFDYKNKYAIVEYLKEIAEEDIFHSIILTHNFDFFRTINSRFVSYNNCYMVEKSDEIIKLINASYIKNPFLYWKTNLHINNEMMVASIPFVRNLVEYTKNKKDPDYKKLTSMLHIKSNSNSITISDLENVFNGLLNTTLSLDNGDKKVMDLIFELATDCLSCDENAKLENKIVLSIAIRLKAEMYMIKKINDQSKTDNIKGNQSHELFKLFKKRFVEEESVKILEQVSLMTPENIHLNSFMYEPILDLSDIRLKKLYSNVNNLT